MQPRAYQLEASETMASVDAALVDASMGTGKTLMALTASSSLPSTLVLAPAVAVSNWVREAAKVGVKAVALRTGSDRTPSDAGMAVCSYDLMVSPAIHHQLASREWSALVLDEAHYLKSVNAKRTQAVFGMGAFRGRGIAEMAEKVWALSGTPCPNNVSELYPLLAGIMPDVIAVNGRVPSLERFTSRYCRGYVTDYGFKITGNKPEATELLSRMGARYIRIRKEDVLSELPPMQIETVVVAGDGATEQVWRLCDKYRDQVQATLDGAAPSEHIASLMRLVEMAKAPDAADLALGLVRAGRKVFIVAKHRDVIDHLEHLLGSVGVVAIHGGTSHKRRDECIEEFTSGPAMVFIGQVQAAGTAITLHGGGKCQDVIAVSMDWVPANNAQAFARVHRIGQPGSVLVRVLALENSIDEKVAETLAAKTRMLEEIFNAA